MIVKVQLEYEGKVYALGVDDNEFSTKSSFEAGIQCLFQSVLLTKRKLEDKENLDAMYVPLVSNFPLII